MRKSTEPQLSAEQNQKRLQIFFASSAPPTAVRSRRNRLPQTRSPSAKITAANKSQPPSSTPTPWRRSTPQGTTPSTPPRSESPAPATARYKPGAFAATRAQQQQTQPPERTSSPAPTKTEEPWQRRGPLRPEDPAPKQSWRSKTAEDRKTVEESSNPPTPQTETDGFQTVEKKGPWRPSRGRGGTRP